jgi:hypothetical protein
METVRVKKPEDREILELVDVERPYPDTECSTCNAPPGYRCPYRRNTTLPRRGSYLEMLSTDTMTETESEDEELVELVDLDSVYSEARRSECTAPPSYRCAYRRYNASLPAAHICRLSQSESGLLHSRPLRLSTNESRPSLGKRTEDLCPLACSKNFSQLSEP